MMISGGLSGIFPGRMKNETDSLERVRAEVLVCPKCRLVLTRGKAVPGEGPPDARLMFVGEAPGSREDELGRPFVGIGGRFLNEVLTKFGIERKHVFITSVNKCRPPANRQPRPDEIESCIPYLWRQIAILNPALIILLGDVALKNVLELEQSLTELRGSIIFWEGREIIPTYHPNAALRFPRARSLMEQDLALVVGELKRMGLWEKVRIRPRVTGHGRRAIPHARNREAESDARPLPSFCRDGTRPPVGLYGQGARPKSIGHQNQSLRTTTSVVPTEILNP